MSKTESEVHTPANYRPVSERTPDSQYQDLLRQIMEEGEEVNPIQGEKAKMIAGAQLHYKLENGFPIITERDLSGGMMTGAIAEHIAFLNGARTQAELEAYGCKWWDRWLTKEQCAKFGLPEGDMGDGSYGAAWTNFPTAEGEPFDQITHVMQQLKERPYLRTHIISPWIPQYTIQHDGLTRKVVVAPCHGYIHILASPEHKELTIHHIQRSGDIPVGVPFNMIQYGVFGLMAAASLGYTLKEIVYTFSDAHIYESQYEHVKELMSREPKTLGTVSLAKTHDNIKDYRPDDFILSDFDPHPRMRIPTPV
jgi:thymidylate synthase